MSDFLLAIGILTLVSVWAFAVGTALFFAAQWIGRKFLKD